MDRKPVLPSVTTGVLVYPFLYIFCLFLGADFDKSKSLCFCHGAFRLCGELYSILIFCFLRRGEHKGLSIATLSQERAFRGEEKVV